MTQPPPPPGTPAPGYGPPPGYGPVPPKQPPVWPWLVGAAAVFVVVLCLVAGGLVLVFRDGRPSATAPAPASDRWESAEPMPRMTPEPSLPEPPRVIGRDVTVSGRGNKTVEVALEPDAAYVATITHDGTSNFMVEGVDAAGRSVDLIVNAIGDYAGDRPVGLGGGRRPTAGFKVRATGTWKIVLRDLSKAPAFTGEASGRKPAVFRVTDAEALGRQITATHSGRDNFVVRGYGDDDRPGLFVNEIGRYRGKQPFPADTQVIEVDAQGGWTLQAA
ncbi:hypothetical protein [Asanoa ishikariensis]|uniref:hypothetical protein n=1 Tax=Asanoa ishikariensis TaxID=137265 RepID=UPI00115FC60C|nr:hypothetical protein [Asanoa ishikariensis]